jgi:hypothetical protein
MALTVICGALADADVVVKQFPEMLVALTVTL